MYVSAHVRRHVQLSIYNHWNLSKVGSKRESGCRHQGNDDEICINLVDIRGI